ncbi:MAG: hypothetical protein IAA73_12070 [Bacteroidetes bacterium]|uniref:Dehydrogenase n=1 Tax=Candidatus Gallipaludibacter merdavium TaxID=2840839 RepID=A0A9D9HVD8_9BACT|nr:hypothetical protein [Candidatus Gallipaludibacter merdavium]
MADNYLEKQYEQYEKRKREWELKNKHGLSKFSNKHKVFKGQTNSTTEIE